MVLGELHNAIINLVLERNFFFFENEAFKNDYTTFCSNINRK